MSRRGAAAGRIRRGRLLRGPSALAVAVLVSCSCRGPAPNATGAAARASSTTVTGAGAARDSARTFALELTSRVLGNTRAIRVHLPPGYHDAANAARRYPVLYMNDGFALFAARLQHAPALVDSLVRRGAVEPFVLVGIDNAASIPGSASPALDRTREYLPWTDPLEPTLSDPRGLRYPDFVVTEVLPLIARRVRVDTARARTALGGSSYGGIAALTTLLHHPARFGALMLESTPTFLFGGRLVRESATIRPPLAALYVGVGTNETTDSTILAAAATLREDITDVVRRTAPATRILVNRVEGARHEVAAWRARFPAAVRFLFPPRR